MEGSRFLLIREALRLLVPPGAEVIETIKLNPHDRFHYAAAWACRERGHDMPWALTCDHCKLRMPPCTDCYLLGQEMHD